MQLDFYKQKNSVFLIIFYLVALIVVFINLQDFGIHIEEKYHRLNGLFWLNYIAELFGLTDLQKITEIKIKDISDYTLSPVSVYNKYGIILDLPAAFIEIVFKINDVGQIYYLKHFIGFLLFLISSFFFFRILNNRYKSFYLSFFGLFLYLTSPRILGDSFLYKDVLFLSFFTITLFYFLESIEKLSIKNLILLSFFTALSFNLRIFSIFIPIFFILILVIKNFHLKKNSIIIKKIIFYFLFLIIFTYIFWPYLWEDPLNKFIQLFTSIKNDLINVKILYFNQFIQNRLVPDTFLLTWIFISSPIFQILFFIFGYCFYIMRFGGRYLKIKKNLIYNDLWRSKGEEKDFTIFLIFTSFFFIFLLTNAPFYNGWRLIYFFNIFLIYFGINFLHILFAFYRKSKLKRNSIVFFIILAISYNIYAIITFHPYQSIYFNSFLSQKIISGFEGDYYGLSAKHFFQKISKIDNKKSITIGVASHTPLQRGLEAIPTNLQKKFIVVGQNYEKADYIYKNNISEVNSRLNKKYEIPINFSKIYELKVNKVKIYEIYKLKN